MTKSNLLLTPYVRIDFDKTTNILLATWVGYLKIEDVKEGCGFMTRYIKENAISLHLSDHRGLKVLSQAVRDYLVREWFPEVEKVGLQKVAALAAGDLFAKIAVSFVNKEAQVGELMIRMFETEEECLSWLLAQES